MILGELFTNNYLELSVVAHRITRRKNPALAEDLLSETFLEFSEKKKIPPSSDKEFIKWYSKGMKLLFMKWNDSHKNAPSFRQWNKQGVTLEFDPPDSGAETEIELGPEEISPATREVISVSSSMRPGRVFRYLQVIEFRQALPIHEQVLFDLYFKNELSTRKISEALKSETGYTFHYKRINNMVNEIKAKINAYQWT